MTGAYINLVTDIAVYTCDLVILEDIQPTEISVSHKRRQSTASAFIKQNKIIH